jgi:ABC-type multidrug transport system ATPase subunit
MRAMINHLCIVIADEPTGSLDEKSASITMDMIINLCRKYGNSLLLITHNQLFAKMQTSYILDSSELGPVLRKMDAKKSVFNKVATKSKISLPSSKIGTTSPQDTITILVSGLIASSFISFLSLRGPTIKNSIIYRQLS